MIVLRTGALEPHRRRHDAAAQSVYQLMPMRHILHGKKERKYVVMEQELENPNP